MKLIIIISCLSTFAFANTDILGVRPHRHSQYVTKTELKDLNMDDIQKGEVPEIIPTQKQTKYNHCRFYTYGQHVVFNDQCNYLEDVMVGFKGGYPICARTEVKCTTDFLLGRKNDSK